MKALFGKSWHMKKDFHIDMTFLNLTPSKINSTKMIL